jgi:Family of unknown function (DUF6444)
MTPEAEIVSLKAENARQRERIAALLERVQELEARLAKATKDSHNSSKPPSSDPLGRKRSRSQRRPRALVRPGHAWVDWSPALSSPVQALCGQRGQTASGDQRTVGAGHPTVVRRRLLRPAHSDTQHKVSPRVATPQQRVQCRAAEWAEAHRPRSYQFRLGHWQFLRRFGYHGNAAVERMRAGAPGERRSGRTGCQHDPRPWRELCAHPSTLWLAHALAPHVYGVPHPHVAQRDEERSLTAG